MAALDAQTVCKAHYDTCASFKDEIHVLDNALEKHEDSLRKAISDTLTGNGTVKRAQRRLCMNFFSLLGRLQDIYFFPNLQPPPPSKVNWVPPKLIKCK